jgi:hypothetical protein
MVTYFSDTILRATTDSAPSTRHRQDVDWVTKNIDFGRLRAKLDRRITGPAPRGAIPWTN